MTRLCFMGIFVFCLLFTFSGCSTYTKVMDTTKSAVKSAAGAVVSAAELVRITGKSDARFKKKVGIADIKNNAVRNDPETVALFHDRLIENLKKECPDVAILEIGDFDAFSGINQKTDVLDESKKKTDNPFLFVDRARKLGINAIALGSILSVSEEKKDSGMFWFKKKKYYLDMSAIGIVYDTETGVKLSEELYEQEFRIDESQYEALKQSEKVGTAELSEAVDHIAEAFSEEICDKISNQPFKAFIVENDGTRVVLSSGSNSGIQAGDLFDVFDKGNEIKGVNDINYMIPGKKAAELKVISVEPDNAVGEFTDGKVDTVMNIVIPK